MSTKTTFKRIALVAVAALGLGVLSVAPSSATATGLAIAVTNGTSTIGGAGNSDSSTAGTVNVTALFDATSDSATVQMVLKSKPGTGADIGRLYYKETSTALGNGSVVDSATSVSEGHAIAANWAPVAVSSASLQNTGLAAGTNMYRITTGAAGYVGGKFIFQLDSTTASQRVVGTYTYTLIAKSYSSANGVSTLQSTVTADISIVVADTAANVALLGGTIDAGRTTAWLNSGSTWSTASDSAVSVVSTASSTDVAVLKVSTFNADGNPTPESVTVTITGAGVVGIGGIFGKSLKVLGTDGVTTFTVRADGLAGLGSIVVATTSKTFPAKTVNFHAKAAKTFGTPSVARPVIDTSSTSDVVRVTATDADGNNWTGAAYIYATSAASALNAGSETPVACTFDAADNRHECPVTGKANGTASFKIIDAATVALATATSTEVSVRVSTATAGSVKLAFDKSSYVPGERAVITAQVLDTAGLAMPAVVLANLFATGAITSNMVLTAVSSNVLTSVSGTVASANSSSDPSNPANAGHVTYVVTMPQTTGTVTLTAKGGTSLAIAGQVAVTASAEVNNPSADAATDAANEATDAANAATDAALAAADAADAATAAAQDASDAVAALSATVAKLVASLKAQITSLTNLVIKIQKKVKA